MIFFHKFYVAMIAFSNMVKCIYKVTDRIAAIRVEVVTHNEIEELEKVMEDRVKNLKPLSHKEDEDFAEPEDGYIH